MNGKIHELEEEMSEFIQLCGNSPTAKLLDYIGANSDDQDMLDGPLNTDSVEGDQANFSIFLNPLDSARSQPKSPTKLKLREIGGTV